ncbi:hypothetical protein FXO38_28400 [Capsicum annuum]|uniref:FAD/NAD(P)-binding domain-containing protein n=1 Tax=Capsicum annuum TaxID=4072 RepID=A0A2G2YSP6_CAPAN|nr:hypothetical protein FXO38_28400 [Capsicum annuum]KAF3630219.1 hypothetical protein FXO37_28557 [Capsicum annuum]PHT72787.1 hypothetical protein T459_23572 [Capsicum annuum]
MTDGVDILEPWNFNISYDKLVIASGAQAMTFGIKGVMEHAIFLHEVHHAQEIRWKLLLNLMLSDVPVDELSLSLFMGDPNSQDLSLAAKKVTINVCFQSGVHFVQGVVKDVQPEKIILSDGTDVLYGLLVWSTGVGPTPFVNTLDLPKVAEHQGKYLAGLLNRLGKDGRGRANSAKDMDLEDPFVYKHLGRMGTIGRYKALVDLRERKVGKGLSLVGFTSWLIWHSAYLTRVVVCHAGQARGRLAKPEEGINLLRCFGLPDLIVVGGLAIIESFCNMTINTFTGEYAISSDVPN